MNKYRRNDPRPGILALIVSAAIFLTAFSFTCHAQAPGTGSNWNLWFDFGLGSSRAGAGTQNAAGGGLSGRAAINLQVNRLLFTLPLAIYTGGKSHIPSIYGKTLKEFFSEKGLLAGYAITKGDNGQWILSAGFSQVSGERIAVGMQTPFCLFQCSEPRLASYYESFEKVMGIPIQLGYFSLGPSASGFSITAGLTVNKARTFGGFTINWMVGRRR